MGQELLQLLPEYQMSCAYICTKEFSHPSIPTSTSLDSAPWDQIDLCIDFSHADGLKERLTTIAAHKTALVLGTTGWDAERDDILAILEESHTPAVWGSNFSIGMYLFTQILSKASSLLSGFPEFDIALLEAHHKAKKDAPSGTLLSLRDEVLAHKTQTRPFHSTHEPTPENGMDIATVRVGHVPGTHMAWLDGPEESIQLTHSVRNRRTFARGALTAARLLQQHEGIWHIHELLAHHLYRS